MGNYDVWLQEWKKAAVLGGDKEDAAVADAATRAYAQAGYRGARPLLWLYERVPGAGVVCETVYGVIARHRSFAFQVTRLLWGIPVPVETYYITSRLFLRLLGAIYLVAFASFGVQAAGSDRFGSSRKYTHRPAAAGMNPPLLQTLPAAGLYNCQRRSQP